MIVAGFGFRAGATRASLQSALRLASSGHDVTDLAAPEDKAGAPCLTELAEIMGLAIHPVPAAVLRDVQTPTQSPQSLSRRKTGSVAEAAALAAAGPDAKLVAPRQISEDRRATCAVAIKGLS